MKNNSTIEFWFFDVDSYIIICTTPDLDNNKIKIESIKTYTHSAYNDLDRITEDLSGEVIERVAVYKTSSMIHFPLGYNLSNMFRGIDHVKYYKGNQETIFRANRRVTTDVFSYKSTLKNSKELRFINPDLNKETNYIIHNIIFDFYNINVFNMQLI